jgi:hypothetical protein
MSLYWICQLTGWIGISILIISLQIAAGAKYDSARMFAGWPLYIGGGILCGHAIRWYLKRANWLTLPMRGIAARLAAGAFLGSVVLGTVTLASIATATGSLQLSVPVLAGCYFNAFFIMFGWVILYAGAGLYRAAERSRVEAMQTRLEAKQAQLAALEQQVNPHFLFNSLNSVRALISEDPRRATEMVTQLADLLRYSLRSDRRETVTLAEELAIVRNYLAIEKTRFEDRLQLEIEVEERSLQERIPPMLLQTLVENAIKHGIAQRTAGGLVRLEARLVDGHLLVDVANGGVLRGGEGGVGLRNARERLRLLFGDRATLTLASAGEDRVLARLELAS